MQAGYFSENRRQKWRSRKSELGEQCFMDGPLTVFKLIPTNIFEIPAGPVWPVSIMFVMSRVDCSFRV